MYDPINEKLALYVIFKTLRAMLERKRLTTKRSDGLPSKYVDELACSLTCRDISKASMTKGAMMQGSCDMIHSYRRDVLYRRILLLYGS